MGPVELTAFEFLTGLTVCGLVGSLMELAARSRLSFAEPFISRRHVVRTVVSTVFAGPLMLANDALAAWRGGRISTLALWSCAATAGLWALASGVVILDLASRAAKLAA
jgi:hypothetical protein